VSDAILVKMNGAVVALVEIKAAMETRALSVEDAVKETRQVANAMEFARVYLERTNASVDAVNRATEVRLLAERQMGEFLREMPKATGTRGQLKGDVPAGARVGGAREEPPTDTLASIGITKKESARAQKLAAMPAEEFHGTIAEVKATGGKITMAALTRATKRDEVHDEPPTQRRAPVVYREITTERSRQIVGASIKFLVNIGVMADSIAQSIAAKNFESAFCSLSQDDAGEIDRQCARGIEALKELRKRIRNEKTKS
jgi:hypothetical protein